MKKRVVKWFATHLCCLDEDAEVLNNLLLSAEVVKRQRAQRLFDVAFQVAAVTQWTMVSDPWYCFFWGEHALGRKVWVKCLFEQIDRTDDEYVKTFCLDQLRWCAWPDQAEEIREIGTKSGSKVLRDFAAVVALELESRR